MTAIDIRFLTTDPVASPGWSPRAGRTPKVHIKKGWEPRVGMGQGPGQYSLLDPIFDPVPPTPRIPKSDEYYLPPPPTRIPKADEQYVAPTGPGRYSLLDPVFDPQPRASLTLRTTNRAVSRPAPVQPPPAPRPPPRPTAPTQPRATAGPAPVAAQREPSPAPQAASARSSRPLTYATVRPPSLYKAQDWSLEFDNAPDVDPNLSAQAWSDDWTAGWEEFGNPFLKQLFVENGLDPSGTIAACGPIAIAGMLRAFGIDSDPGQIARAGQDQGLWTAGDGMLTPMGEGVARLLTTNGLPVQIIGTNQLEHALALLQRGTPVVLNFPKHYMLAQKYDPTTGRFYVGSTGSNALDGGAEWMTLEEMGAHPGNGGPVENFIVPTTERQQTGTSMGDEPLVTQPDTSSREATVRSIEPLARYWEQRTNIPAEVFIAFNLHEGGSKVMAAPFGIKGPGTSQSTWEEVNGQRVNITDSFRSYDTLNDAYRDFIDLVSQGRYKSAWDTLQRTGNWQQWLWDINRAGYATDSQWGGKIANFAATQVHPYFRQSRPGLAPTRGAPRPTAPLMG